MLNSLAFLFCLCSKPCELDCRLTNHLGNENCSEGFGNKFQGAKSKGASMMKCIKNTLVC